MVQTKQFIEIVEKDREGYPYGIMNFNTEHIVFARYVMDENTLIIGLTKQETDTGLASVALTNKQGHKTGAFTTGVASNTRNTEYLCRNEENIVIIYNALNGTDYSVETFPGFIMREEQKKRIEEAIAKKKAEEEEAAKKAEAEKGVGIVNPHGEAIVSDQLKAEIENGTGNTPEIILGK